MHRKGEILRSDYDETASNITCGGMLLGMEVRFKTVETIRRLGIPPTPQNNNSKAR